MITEADIDQTGITINELLKKLTDHRELLAKAEEQFNLITQTTAQFTDTTQQNIQYLRNAVLEMKQDFAEIITMIVKEQNVLIESLRKQTQNHLLELNNISDTVCGQLKNFRRKQFWDRIYTTCLAALFGGLIAGFYINAEMPWESKQKAVNERTVGKMVLNAWQHLTPQEQQQLQRMIRKDLYEPT